MTFATTHSSPTQAANHDLVRAFLLMVPNRELWQEELDLALQSGAFARAKEAKRLLAWLVKQVASGETKLLNEYDVALHVFDRADHDPAADAHIRKQISRLRVRLSKYYEYEGQFRPYEIRVHGFTPELVPVARSGPVEDSSLILLQPFEAGTPELIQVACRLTDEVAHLLARSRRLQLGVKSRPAKRQMVLNGSLWLTDGTRDHLVFARISNEIGIVVRSLRLTCANGAALDTCAEAILTGLFPPAELVAAVDSKT